MKEGCREDVEWLVWRIINCCCIFVFSFFCNGGALILKRFSFSLFLSLLSLSGSRVILKLRK